MYIADTTSVLFEVILSSQRNNIRSELQDDDGYCHSHMRYKDRYMFGISFTRDTQLYINDESINSRYAGYRVPENLYPSSAKQPSHSKN